MSVAHTGQVPHYYGFETAGGFEEARQTAQGDDWRDQVRFRV
jgi:hypothetical protein